MAYLGKFHSDFKKAVLNTDTFENFVDAFYTGKYLEQISLKEYFFENDTKSIRIFVENKYLVSEIAYLNIQTNRIDLLY